MFGGDDRFEAWATLRLGVRLPLGFSPDDWYARLMRLASKEEVRPVGSPVSAYRANKNSPLVRAFLHAIRANGGSPGFVLKTGTADLNIVASRWDCPALAYGPGDSALDHTPQEHLSLSEYLRAVDVIEEVLRTLTDHVQP